MDKRAATAVTLAAALTAVLCPTGVAVADSPVPQAGTPCSPALADALTRLPDEKTYLMCRGQPGAGYQWETVTPDYPISDRWLTYGPPLKLHGQGLRNPNMMSGDWIASPQDPKSQCRAEQTVVISPGVVSAPRINERATGQPLSFQVLPTMFSTNISGDCLWARVVS